jgi:Ca2+-binding EF-hand superfamily protein
MSNFAFKTQKYFQAEYFCELDKDNSGYLELPELKTALKRMYSNVDEDKAEKILETYDTNNDGRLDFSESREFCYNYAVVTESKENKYKKFINRIFTKNK